MLFRGYTKRQIDKVVKNTKSTKKILRTLKHKRHMCRDEKTEKYLEDTIKMYTELYESESYHEN